MNECDLYLAIDFEPDVALSTALNDRTDRHEADDERLALLNVDHHLPANIGATKEVARRDDTYCDRETLLLLD